MDHRAKGFPQKEDRERRRHRRPPGAAIGRHDGLTLVELLVTACIAGVVFAGAHALASTGRRCTRKALDTSAAVQNGLLLLRHLRDDLSALAIDPTAVARGNHIWIAPDRRSVVFNRLEPVDDVHGGATRVSYATRRTPRNNLVLERTLARDGAIVETKRFHRLVLRDLSFRALTYRDRHFVRVTFRALGEDLDLAAMPARARPRPRLFSLLTELDVAQEPVRPSWVISRLPPRSLMKAILEN